MASHCGKPVNQELLNEKEEILTKNKILETRSSSQQKEIQKLKDIVKNSSSSQQEEIQKLKDENEKLRYIIDNFEKDIVKNIIFETEKELKEEK